MLELAMFISITGFLWGLGPIFDKVALNYFSSENATFLRAVVGAIFVSFFILIAGNPKAIISEFNIRGFAAIIGSAVVGFGGVYTFYRVINLPQSQVSTAYAIALAICPVVTAILAHIYFGENLFKLTKISGLLFIVVGIFLVANQKL
ncbi:EamA family transporter [bacterium]|nr:EamA family transporter [bacterium]